jgi:hypothetical protein
MSGRKPRRVAQRKQNGTLNIERDVEPDRRVSLTQRVMPRKEREPEGDRHPKQIEFSV